MRALRPATVPRPALLLAPAFTLFLALTFFSATAQTGTAQAATAQAATAQTGTAQTGTARAATAQSGYRYWSFWQQKDNGSWSYAIQGPAVLRPDDGEILGFRFALSEDSRDAEQPRGTTDFTDACAHTPKKSGTKRVAIRIDFGTPADAPKGEPKSPPKPRTECVRVDDTASAADALAAVATPLRYNSESLLCGISRYPTQGCGEQAESGERNGEESGNGGNGGTGDKGEAGGKSDASDASGGGDSGGDSALSTGLGVIAGIATVAVLGAAALWQARRRRP
ncbi:SCO2322 family protein [Streptomyces sp. NBC_01795]|uniref:SCO2322 family protein n=1 Tax=unclassified Streptomyces TaxID=2593676 RepID=UPI002DDC62E3|nr:MULTISPECIES: SCO2322 family protein [unclassified Streptomyces]WSA95011.1 SCO2322 family protein [Streptomyces sp. NBC_01795]WSB79432.1 SCO2322 family protein [Streptomyces sp. NBC_01775]WSS12364.1 SCO2322 family protein [Streptomyces sp. NBC_01186]